MKSEKTLLYSVETPFFWGMLGDQILAQKSKHMTQDELAGLLFDSLRNKIMPLSDDITVYPAHGAGSACGKNMMKETVDTLGNQKKVNYALRENMTEGVHQRSYRWTRGPSTIFPLKRKNE